MKQAGEEGYGMSSTKPGPPNSETVDADHSLLERFRNGEQDAATELYLKYASRLRALASAKTPNALNARFDADDIVQSIFRTLFRRVSNGMYDVPPGEELWNLLLIIGLNKIRRLAQHHRALKRDATRTQSDFDLLGEAPTENDRTSLKVLEWVIDDLLQELPPSNRQMIELRIEGNRAVDIAARTSRSQRTVERVLRHFREELSRRIRDDWE